MKKNTRNTQNTQNTLNSENPTISFCHCKSGQKFEECCQPYLQGLKIPKTAEQLMRSRFSAFCTENINYIKETHREENRTNNFDESATLDWAKENEFFNLEIIKTDKGLAEHNSGTVEFKAHFRAKGNPGLEQVQEQIHHERARFMKVNNKWLFCDGDIVGETITRSAPKIGRNDPCPCGSNKKFKKCCGQ